MILLNNLWSGLKVNKTVEVHLMMNAFQLVFRDFQPTLKPSLHFSSKVSSFMLFCSLTFIINRYVRVLTTFSAYIPQLRISRYDRKPLGSMDLMYSAVIEVIQRTSMMNDEATTLTLPVPEDGNVHIKFKLQDEVVMLFIRVGMLKSGFVVCKMSSFSTVGQHTHTHSLLLRK